MTAQQKPLHIRIIELKRLTTAAINEQAKALYDLEKVTEQMTKCGLLGVNRLQLRPKGVTDLSKTPAALELVKELEAVGVRCEWQPSRPAGPDAPVVQILALDWS